MWRGSAALCNHSLTSACDAGGQCAQFGIKWHDEPLARLAIEQRALRHGGAEHLFKAQALRAQLDFVGAVRLGVAALVFYWIRRNSVKLDRVGLARKPMRERTQHQPAHRSHPRTPVCPAAVDALVHQSTFGSCAIFGPHALNMDQRALAWTEQIVLQRRHWDQRVFGGRVRWWRLRHRFSTSR